MLSVLVPSYITLIAGVAHAELSFTKNSRKSSVNTALIGAAGTVLNMTPDGRGRRYLAICSRYFASDHPIVLESDNATLKWKIVPRKEQISQARRKIRSVLKKADGPLSPREIADMAQMNTTNVRQLLWKMHDGGQVVKRGRAMYELPKESAATDNNGDNA